MKRLVLFRFHQNRVVCKNRLDVLRRYNPAIEIHGLYGGEESMYPNVQRAIGDDFSSLFCLKGKTAQWKWLHGDLAVREWYQAVGRLLAFDVVHLVEWDLVLLDSLENLYRHVPAAAAGITGLVRMELIKDRWCWTSRNSWWTTQWERLLAHVEEVYQYDGEPYASQGPGLCLPRKFLELYAAAEVPRYCHDEVRLPLFAQSFGIDLFDTGFYDGWFNGTREAFFNCRNQEINPQVMWDELGRTDGRRAFHPFRQTFAEQQHDLVSGLPLNSERPFNVERRAS